jgi:hypothetical protein
MPPRMFRNVLKISERFSNRVTSGLSGTGGGMADNNETMKNTIKFAGIEVPPELTRSNFFFLFFNTFLGGMLMSFFGSVGECGSMPFVIKRF